MSGETARVHYFDRQFLRVDEFLDEQQYQLALRRRHNNTQHIWGIVRGLEIAIEGESIVVQPGMGIDGYGRELLLTIKKTVAPESFDDRATDRLDLWLVYDRKNDGDTPGGYAECGKNGQSYRSSEAPELIIERPVANNIDARRPPGVPKIVLDAPVPPVSDDPLDVWRVYLGRVIRLEPGKFSVDMTRRPYVGTVAETIDHPGSAARVEIGRESDAVHTRTVGATTFTYLADEKRRFGVFVPEDLDPLPERVDLLPRIDILSDGQINLRGHTEVHGNVQLAGGALQFTQGIDFASGQVPELPSMYRYEDGITDEVRIDLGVDNPGERKFVIGFSKPDGSFSPCVTVELQPNDVGDLEPVVTVHGDLNVLGKLIGRILPVNVSPEAQAAINAQFQMGLTAGNNP